MPHQPIPSRTREDLIEEVKTITQLAELDGVSKAAEYLRRILQDEFDSGWSSSADAREEYTQRRTKMPRGA